MCLNGGNCTDDHGQYAYCNCAPGWTGLDCGEKCESFSLRLGRSIVQWPSSISIFSSPVFHRIRRSFLESWMLLFSHPRSLSAHGSISIRQRIMMLPFWSLDHSMAMGLWPFWPTILIYRFDLPFWSTILIYHFDLPFWSTVLIYRFDLPFWSTILIYHFDLPFWSNHFDLPFWSTVLIYHFDLPFWSTILIYHFDLTILIYRFDLPFWSSILIFHFDLPFWSNHSILQDNERTASIPIEWCLSGRHSSFAI